MHPQYPWFRCLPRHLREYPFHTWPDHQLLAFRSRGCSVYSWEEVDDLFLYHSFDYSHFLVVVPSGRSFNALLKLKYPLDIYNQTPVWRGGIHVGATERRYGVNVLWSFQNSTYTVLSWMSNRYLSAPSVGSMKETWIAHHNGLCAISMHNNQLIQNIRYELSYFLKLEVKCNIPFLGAWRFDISSDMDSCISSRMPPIPAAVAASKQPGCSWKQIFLHVCQTGKHDDQQQQRRHQPQFCALWRINQFYRHYRRLEAPRHDFRQNN